MIDNDTRMRFLIVYVFEFFAVVAATVAFPPDNNKALIVMTHIVVYCVLYGIHLSLFKWFNTEFPIHNSKRV